MELGELRIMYNDYYKYAFESLGHKINLIGVDDGERWNWQVEFNSWR